MSLAEDIGFASQPVPNQPQVAPETPTPSKGSLAADIGFQMPGTQGQPEKTGTVDKNFQVAGNVAKQAPRNLMEGIGQAADLFSGRSDADIPAQSYEETQPHPMVHLVAQKLADKLEKQIPQLQVQNPDPISQVVGAGIRAAPSGLLAGPGGILPAFLSGAGSEAAKQAGAGPLGQVATGAALGFSPALGAAGARGALTSDAAAARSTLQDFKNAEVIPTGSQVGIGSNAGAATQRTLGAQPGQMSASVNKTFPATGNLEAGEGFNEGVKQARVKMAGQESQAFQGARNLIGGDTPFPATKATQVAKDITSPFPGKENDTLNDFIASTKSEQIRGVLKEQGQKTTQSSLINPDTGQPFQSSVTGMTFDKIRALRSRVGEMIDWSPVPSGSAEANGQLKRLYNALGEDIEQGISKQPPLAQNAYKAAVDLYKRNMDNRRTLDETLGSGSGGFEGTFQRMIKSRNLSQSPVEMSKIWGAMGPDEQNTFRNALTNRMQYPGGNEGRGFDENVFLRNWQNMHPQVKDMVYGTQGNPLRDKMEGLGNVMEIRQNMGQNTPTPLAQAVAQGTQKGTGPIRRAMNVIGTGLGTGAGILFTEHAGAALQEMAAHPFLTIGGGAVAGTALGTRTAMGRILNNQNALNWLAQANQAPKNTLPILISQLSRMGQTGQDLQEVLNSPSGEEKK